MRYLVVNDDASPDEIREAITNLREKQQRACIPSTAEEIGEDINELLEILFADLPS